MARLGALVALLGLLAAQCTGLRRLPQSVKRATDNTTTGHALEVVQAATPPRTSFDGYACSQTLVEYQFANSYGTPFVGFYSPPPANCSFTTTIFNLSVSSQGQQYDRLATLFLGDVEVWRTSTAMPIAEGIHWSFQKDMSIFDALLREDQKIILDLGNVVDGVLYTGAYNVTIEALYFDDTYTEGFHPAELIYPISHLSAAENKSSVFSLPDDSGSVSISLPRNIKTAVVSLLASGNGEEEFWYTNVPTEYLDTFGSDSLLYGYSPFREVQLLIDGQLAGVSWPFPILFTGGVDPGLWRPIVGIDAFDLPSFEIDVTPWLSLLCDGEEHTFKFQVIGYDSSASDGIGTVGQNWYVTGSLFVWLDDTVNQTVAGPVSSNISALAYDYIPKIGTTLTNGSVTNESLWVYLTAQRSISITSSVSTANGSEAVSWIQDLDFFSIQNVTNESLDSDLAMNSSGQYSSSVSGAQVSEYSYPLYLYSSYYLAATDAELSSVFSAIDRSLLTTGISTLPFASGMSLGTDEVATRQNVTSNYYWNATIVGGIEQLDTCNGETWYSSSGFPGNGVGVPEYSRYLREEDDEMVADITAYAALPVPSTGPLSL
ncbi:hypothetical protein N0V93_008649 [Gnomoniopsis smithogilvyi]|uniref:Peptide N-acetyl-beta-D-glucosaminyl asparaginase amidase A N-terminal domain-containing protein n=1 Tax=Gnomoniopsis smithogilvyi TaxID=1191159 RepID=A0A9W8YM36_9PEZI|nr:hypothetical protein N0V93_008649 [Gnomoniopsis smithogilvyi]